MAVLAAAAAATAALSVLFVPLDERFVTRDSVLNIARVTPFVVSSPGAADIGHRKSPSNVTFLQQWLEERAGDAQMAIISVEQLLYGGLIPSRCSNESSSVIADRVAWLAGFARRHPSLRLYLSTVVMRIPAYDGDFEEPAYWAQFGFDLFKYSYLISEYRATGNATYLDQVGARAAAHVVSA